jgi:hypothetical protein
MIKELFHCLVKPRCSCCGARRVIFRHGKCFACYQGELDVLADHKIIEKRQGNPSLQGWEELTHTSFLRA